MKLKYILPVATIASVATVATPLVTSCANGSSLSFNYLKNGELTEYEPKYAAVSGEEAEITDPSALTVIYYRDWSKNKKLFADDMLHFGNLIVMQAEDVEMTEAKGKVTVSSVNAEKHIASFDIDFSFVGTTEGGELKAKDKIHVKNFPIVVSEYVPSAMEGFNWGLAPSFWNVEEAGDVLVSDIVKELNKNKGWEWSVEHIEGEDSIEFSFNENKLPTEADKNNMLRASNFLQPQLYHFKNNDRPTTSK